MTKTIVSLLTAVVLFPLVTHATITLQHSIPFSGDLASNFANAAGTPTNGMSWGILVDTGNDGFLGGFYESFDITTNQFLPTAGGLSNDYFVLSSNVTVDTSAALENDLTTAGGSGSITDIVAPDASSAPYSINNQYALIWFSNIGDTTASIGDPYGLFTDAALTIPSDGSTVNRSTPFDGVDPVRAANLTVIPEPSVLGLLAFGALAILRRPRKL